jgi:plastocyanin
MQKYVRALGAAAAVASLIACGSDLGTAGASTDAEAAATPAPSGTGASTGTVHIVEMITDPADGANKYVPAALTVKQGDVIRYVLRTGVHNVNFLRDSNPGKAGLPVASPMLQLPEQTHDVVVNFGSGHYYYHCDPHVPLGMKGHVMVQ